MNILTTILIFFAMLIIIFAANFVCKKYIFSKVRINKWIPLSIAIILFVAQTLLGGNTNIYVTSALSIVSILFFLWFMDIAQKGKPKMKGKEIKIKPKAKPNRVKKNK